MELRGELDPPVVFILGHGGETDADKNEETDHYAAFEHVPPWEPVVEV
jgi:hypothetical protein